MIYCFGVLLLILFSFFLQEFCPLFSWLHDSRVLLVHAVFFASAVSVPFPVMLVFAFIAGFIWDTRYHVPMNSIEGGVYSPTEIPFGFTIFIFGLLGVFIQGVRPFFRQGRWGLPVLMVGVCTFAVLLLEYMVISFNRDGLLAAEVKTLMPEVDTTYVNRGGLIPSAAFFWKISMTALYSTLLAPFLLLLFSRLAGFTGFKIQMDGISRRYSYDGDSF